jgi:hypothetical protein
MIFRKTLVGAAALLSSAAFAQSSDRWEFSGSINLFVPSLKATSVFPANGGGSQANIDSGAILDSLDLAFMGTFEAQKGVWGFFTDVMYVDMSNSKSGSRSIELGRAGLPAGVDANLDLSLRATSWTVAGSYRLATTPRYKNDLLAGARLLDVRTGANWSLNGNVGSVALADRTGSRSNKQTNWDFIVGAKGRLAVGAEGKWFVPYYLDVGAGESKWTAQAMTGVGYAFSWGDLVGSWRYLGYGVKSGGAFEDLSLNGPMVSAVFHW